MGFPPIHPHALKSTTYLPHPATENGPPMSTCPVNPSQWPGPQSPDDSSTPRLGLHSTALMFGTPINISYSAKALGGPAGDRCIECDTDTHNPSISTRWKPHALCSYTQYKHRAPMQSQRPPILPAHNPGPLVEWESPAATQPTTNPIQAAGESLPSTRGTPAPPPPDQLAAPAPPGTANRPVHYLPYLYA